MKELFIIFSWTEYIELKEMKQEYTKDEKGRETLLSTSTRQCIRQLIQIVFFNLYNNYEKLIKVNTFSTSTIDAKPVSAHMNKV